MDWYSGVRVINHIDDKRRPRCKDSLTVVVRSRVSDAEVEQLDAHERFERTLARRNGHTHVKAKPLARKATKSL